MLSGTTGTAGGGAVGEESDNIYELHLSLITLEGVQGGNHRARPLKVVIDSGGYLNMVEKLQYHLDDSN